LRDGSISIRDLATARETSFAHHKSGVNSLALSPDGKLAVSASSDGTACVFNSQSGAVCRVLSHNGTNVICAAVSDDGWVATGTVKGTIRLWNPQAGLVKHREMNSASINAIAISEGGQQVVVGQSSHVSSWDVANDRHTNYRGLSDLAYCVGISRDGRRIAAGEYTGHLYLWDLGAEQPRLKVKGHAGPIYALVMSSDGESIVTGGADRAVRVWNARSGTMAKELPAQAGLIFSVSYDVRHQRIVAGGKGKLLMDWSISREPIVPVSAVQPAGGKN
jgi:WD40 repeat protein